MQRLASELDRVQDGRPGQITDSLLDGDFQKLSQKMIDQQIADISRLNDAAGLVCSGHPDGIRLWSDENAWFVSLEVGSLIVRHIEENHSPLRGYTRRQNDRLHNVIRLHEALPRGVSSRR